MRAEDLVFWLDALRPDTHQANGVLCRRHADSMVLPRHWTLDDLREPVPRLFQPPAAAPITAPAARRRKHSVPNDGEQLLLAAPVDDAATQTIDTLVDESASPDDDGTAPVSDLAGVEVEAAAVLDAAVPWTPTFDENDDLDGLLAARSPLLARAFRGDDRPRQG